jgi:hypothetical protein
LPPALISIAAWKRSRVCQPSLAAVNTPLVFPDTGADSRLRAWRISLRLAFVAAASTARPSHEMTTP